MITMMAPPARCCTPYPRSFRQQLRLLLTVNRGLSVWSTTTTTTAAATTTTTRTTTIKSSTSSRINPAALAFFDSVRKVSWDSFGRRRRYVSSSSSATSEKTTTTATTTTSNHTKPKTSTKPVPGLPRRGAMDYVTLGGEHSDLIISKVSMGTMMMGSQTNVDQSIELLTTAFDEYGVNCIDTAELYPVPTLPPTQGDTDRIVAKFWQTRSSRQDVVIATKVTGRSPHIHWLPRSKPETLACLSKDQILWSVDASLERLETDYIDLLQLHWPDRHVPIMGQPDFCPETYEQSPTPVPFAEQLQALQQVIQEGKVRYVGVANETAYGVCTMAQMADTFPELYPKIVSTQNPYSLVCRKDYECALAEVCYHHNIGLLAFSPLAGGALTGKYRNNSLPDGTRFAQYTAFMERYLKKILDPVDAYCVVAENHGLTPVQLALSWCFHNPLVSSTLIGVTTLDQLHENLQAYDVPALGPEVLQDIQRVYRQYMDPTKELF